MSSNFPKTMAILWALLLIACFFLPHMTAKDETREVLNILDEFKVAPTSTLTYGDVMDLSLFEHALLFYQIGDDLLEQELSGFFYTVAYAALGVLPILILLLALGNMPGMMFFFSLLLSGDYYLIHWDLQERGIVPSSMYDWGIVHYMLPICTALLLIFSLYMMFSKRHRYLYSNREAPGINTNRSLIVYILFNVLTLGLYSLIFWHGYVRDVNILCSGDGKNTKGIFLAILLSIVTLGIYMYIWEYGMQNRIRDRAPKYGVENVKDGGAIILWDIFGLLLFGIGPMIALYIRIKSLNSLAYAYNARANRFRMESQG